MRGRIIFLVVVLVAIGAFVVYNLLPKDSTSKASVSQGVVQFRAAMDRAAGFPDHSWADIPPYGVYRYSTRGSESISSFIIGTSHNYNGVSTVTLLPTRCGVMERWQPLVERWSEGYLCLKPKTSSVAGIRDFHDFFDQTNQTNYTCTGGSAPYAPAMRPGMSWTTNCTSDQGTLVSHAKVVDLERVEVGGEPIDAVHLRSSVILGGDPAGTDVRNSWLRRSDGLLLRRTDNDNAHVDAAGGSDYSEQYELNLISTTPQR